MQTQQKHFKAWRAFWGEVLTMWRKEHGITLANCFKASFPIALLSLGILIVSVIKNSDSWRLGSGIALGISGFIAFFNLCFIFPFKKYTLDTEKLTKELKPLREIRDNQLLNLNQTNSTLIMSRLDSVQFHGLKDPERSIVVIITFFDCSVFSLELKDVKFYVGLNGSPLALVTSLKSPSTKVTHGAIISLQFKQPLGNTTSDIIESSIEKREKIMWKFELNANCIIEETKDVFSFTHVLTHEEIPFLVK